LRIFDKFKDRFTTDGYFKYRTISVTLAAFFGLLSVFWVIILLPGLFGIGIFPAAAGMFFVRSFGILSLLIPVYFAFASIILADTKWRPDRIFLLNGFLLPFMTLSVGFAFIRDYEIRSLQFALLNFTGKTGFSMLIISLTAIETLLLMVLRNALFLKEAKVNHYRKKQLMLPASASRPAIPEHLPEHTAKRDNYQNDDITHRAVPAFNDNFYPETSGEMSSEDPVLTDTQSGVSDTEIPDNLSLSLEVFGGEINYYEKAADFADNPDIADDDIDLTAEDTVNFADSDTAEVNDDCGALGVKRALDEAEAAAAAHGEQIRKKIANTKKIPYKKYKIPVDILNEYPDGEYWIIDQATRDAAIALKETLEEFKIQAEVTGIRKGPVITMFEILPAPGVKLSRIVGLQDNIALRLAASSVRIVAPIPGKHAVGIEVPNAKRNIVSFREIIEGELKQGSDKMGIPVVMGKDITGEGQTVDLVQMPHLLIAGATGSGKSVCVNSIILSILYQLHPAECRLMLIDPKIVELKLYNDIPHLLTPVITEPKKAFQALQYCIYEMERRYACLDAMGVRDIRSYNRRIKEKNIAQEHLPYIVVIIDEFADLMTTTGKELESTVARLAAMSRAVGIHLVLATQRPSIDVITGLIKANIPSRIAFMVASKTDSRIIIDMVGAEKLLGKGDMLYSGVVDPFPIRMQGAFISEEEVEAVVEHVKTFGAPDYIDDEIFFEDEEDDSGMSLFSDGDDPLYEKALEIVMLQGKASASFIQRRLKIGFNRAARLVDEMEHHGVVGPAQGSKPRELLRGSGYSAPLGA